MTKKGLNLRKVVTIVACLVVTTMFAACDRTNPDDDDKNGGGNGKIDAKLVGIWEYSSYYNGSTEYYNFFFNKDETFHYFLIQSSEYSYKGKYSTSNGKIYFTNVVFYRGQSDGSVEKYDQPDSWVGYVFDKNEQGKERLKLDNSGGSWMGSTWWLKK